MALLPPPLHAKEITTADIMTSATTCTACLDWKISGLCFWLKCTAFSCKVKSSARVTHYLPDAVVSAYSERPPWHETADWNPTPGAALTDNNTADQTTIDFKHVTVIGNPALIGMKAMGNSEYFCTSGEIPYIPYFLSGLDRLGWHRQLPELFYPQAWVGIPSIGPWGAWQQVYPRCGWTSHPDDPTSAAVTALRAVHIVSRQAQPHVYWPMRNACGDNKKCWPPGAIDHKGTGFQWQMITPVRQRAAEDFGQVRPGANWANGKYTNDEHYAWHLWREYSCCKPKGLFLYHVAF